MLTKRSLRERGKILENIEEGKGCRIGSAQTAHKDKLGRGRSKDGLDPGLELKGKMKGKGGLILLPTESCSADLMKFASSCPKGLSLVVGECK
jgi:hypothetical protein